MRKFNLKSGVIGLAVIGLAACSHDDIQTPTSENRTDIERSLYVNISIHGDAAESRADGAGENGTPVDDGNDFTHVEAESEIKSVYFVFYDDNGNPVGDVVSGAPTWDNQTTPSNTVETVGKETLMITLAAGQENPTQVVCYINPINRTQLKNPLSTIQTIELESVYREEDGKTYFPMSNSVYYDNAGNLVTATKLNDNVFDTFEAAEKALEAGEGVVDIYVERYASKLQMNVDEDQIKAYETGTLPDDDTTAPTSSTAPIKVTLSFNYKSWELNGVANSSYPVKSFREASTTGQILPSDMSYNFLNNRINYNGYYTSDMNAGDFSEGNLLGAGNAWAWNNYSFHRSYWACSPVYFQSEYPEVAPDLAGIADINQTFYKYSEVVKNGKEFGKPYYFPETTSGIPALTSANPAAAVPSVILVGDYSIKVGDTEIASTEENPVSFYTYVPVRVDVDGQTLSRPSVYFETGTDELSSAVGNNTMSMKKRFLWQASIFYKKLTNGTYDKYDMANATDRATLTALTEVTRPNDDVLGDVKMADRTKTLQIKEDATIPANVYINDNGIPRELVGEIENPTEDQITIDDANKILWMNVGTCNYYSKSRGFFNIPVKHTGWYRNGNNQKGEADIDFSLVRVGDLGMVRNHYYSIKVSKILGLATGVGGDDYPLLPAADTKDVYVAYRVNILKWAVVPEQVVELQ